MRRWFAGALVLFVMAGSVAAALDAWCAHVTNAAGWKTSISFYNPGAASVTATATRYGADGNPYGALIQVAVPPLAWASVSAEDLAYNGTTHLTAPSDLEVKLSYQFGDSPSVCEFFLAGEASRGWMLPNTVRSWMNYTGVALMNPLETPISVIFEAWLGGNLVASATEAVPARGQFLRLSDGIWSGVSYQSFDTIRIRSSAATPAPIDITGNYAGDRHLFFSGRPFTFKSSGDLEAVDAIVGNLRYVEGGTYTQGSSLDEACRDGDEGQFSHTLSLKLAVMETEVSRQMWGALQAVQPTLPADPSDTSWGGDLSLPVQRLTWSEAILFANLLSLQQGRTRCYYLDAGFTNPVTAANYQTNAIFCHWNANGYRLPSEGEWECCCRGGAPSTWPFGVEEPAYGAGNCGSCTPSPALTGLTSAAWWCGNGASQTHPIGAKSPNAWNLKDFHGNVLEWCWDWSGTYPTWADNDYRGPSSGTFRIVRGGGYGSYARYCRSANRETSDPNFRRSSVGFRLVRTLP